MEIKSSLYSRPQRYGYTDLGHIVGPVYYYYEACHVYYAPPPPILSTKIVRRVWSGHPKGARRYCVPVCVVNFIQIAPGPRAGVGGERNRQDEKENNTEYAVKHLNPDQNSGDVP